MTNPKNIELPAGTSWKEIAIVENGEQKIINVLVQDRSEPEPLPNHESSQSDPR